MHPILRNILAVVLGLVAGSAVNIFLVNLNGILITLPEGADVSTMEGLAASMSLFEPIHFLMPFLGHALGTLVGAFLAGAIATQRKLLFALAIGVFFLIGGVINAYMLPAPNWFIALDLIVAYLPMAWIGGALAQRTFPKSSIKDVERPLDT